MNKKRFKTIIRLDIFADIFFLKTKIELGKYILAKTRISRLLIVSVNLFDRDTKSKVPSNARNKYI